MRPFIKAKPTFVGGILYASRLEARVARLFIGNKISFKPHVEFTVFDRNGKPYNYTVDFLLNKPYKFAGISAIVDVIEVKGLLRKKDIHRIEALNYCHFTKGWIATEPLISMWEKEGMFWTLKDRDRFNGIKK